MTASSLNRYPTPGRTIDRRIVGSREHVRRSVDLAARSGRLVHVSPWSETPEGFQVTVRLIERAAPPPPARPVRRRRRGPVAAACAVGATVLGVLAYAVVQLVNAIVAAFPLIVGGVLLLGLVSLLLSAVGSRTFSGTFTGRLH